MTQQNNIQKTQAADPQQVLVDYLDQLLNESPAAAEEVAKPAAVAAEVLAEPVVSEVPAEAPVEAPAENVSESETTVVKEQLSAEVLEQIKDAPDWAQQPSFQVLLFKVSGITLAVPLDSLNGILEWNEDNITEMPGAAEYFLGLLPERDRQIKLVDTASIVVPSNFRQNHCRENLQKIILIGDGEWGLACDVVDEVITLAPTDVRWRSNQGLRPWLAGTVVEQMSALLNVDKFVDLLSSEQLQVAD
jgi:purine-binding chemotaxis protein CheW